VIIYDALAHFLSGFFPGCFLGMIGQRVTEHVVMLWRLDKESKQ
jgi:hypothetical protein